MSRKKENQDLKSVLGNWGLAFEALRVLVNAMLAIDGTASGQNSVFFSAVNAVMLRDLPFPDPGRLVQVWEQNPDRGWYQNVVAPANYVDWQAQAAG